MRVREKRDAYTCAPPHREGRRYGCQQSLSGLRERVACAREREGRMHTRERGAHARARGVFRRSGRRGFTQRTFTSPGPSQCAGSRRAVSLTQAAAQVTEGQ